MSSGKKFDVLFDELFGDAQEYIPDPTEIEELDGEFDALDEDEDDAGGEEELAEVDCTEIPADTEISGEDTDEDEDDSLDSSVELEDGESDKQ